MNSSKFIISKISLKDKNDLAENDESLDNSNNLSITQLRSKLKWNNDLAWKKICKLRNKYIIEFNLLELNLKNVMGKTRLTDVCKLLINEFNVDSNQLDLFIKVVILGIQSIKRNKKRNAKNKLEHLGDKSEISEIKITKADVSLKNKDQSTIIGQQSNRNNNFLDILKDIVDNVKPIKEVSQLKSINNLPNLSIFIDDNIDLVSNNSKKKLRDSDKDIIPFFLIEKTILNIQNSKTCFNLVKDTNISTNNNIIDEENGIIIKMGESILHLTTAYILERFMFNLPSISKKYIWDKLNSLQLLNSLSYQLFHNFTYIKMKKIEMMPSDDIDNDTKNNITLLKLTLGALVKDFGFDSVLYDISEIIYHIITTRYPLQSDSSRSNMANKSKVSNHHYNGQFDKNKDADSIVHMPNPSVIFSSLSMKPNVANTEIYKTVKIQFNNKEQEFKYSILSNASPTIAEIIDNCIKLFNILNRHNLAIFHRDERVMDDQKLSKLFNELNSTELILILKRLV